MTDADDQLRRARVDAVALVRAHLAENDDRLRAILDAIDSPGLAKLTAHQAAGLAAAVLRRVPQKERQAFLDAIAVDLMV